ncbi:hypothetical protein BS47DRAFT_1370980 [Hydnum rufescens UP504]|uniref:tRNA-dihydrouridine(47) synthase [NAD(P)(+)] n=1 Tax=Hydnum rufescens UP504 TaxID=1448309 RepID=A0A9P6B6J6_9AGAM|nr:hypothetical protein BS47DRAFT_1370980 [Hydnum rufescens UP504]
MQTLQRLGHNVDEAKTSRIFRPQSDVALDSLQRERDENWVVSGELPTMGVIVTKDSVTLTAQEGYSLHPASRGNILQLFSRFLIYDRPPISIDDDLAEAGKDSQGEVDTRSAPNGDEPPGKKPRLSGAQKKKLARGAKQTGANKGRHFAKAKPKDLSWSAHPPLISSCAPFLPPHEARSSDLVPSVDLSTACPIFLEKGCCKHGFKCRFLGGHIRHTDSANGDIFALAILRDETVELSRIGQTKEGNAIDPGVLKQLRSRKYATPLADAYLLELETNNAQRGDDSASAEPSLPLPQDSEISVETDTPDVPSRPSEKKRLHWAGQTYLAPLTTVGNLPFRRLACSLGADITCSEMALSHSLLSGSKEEWSLVRRHPSEKTFGVQIAGGKPGLLTRASEVLAQEIGSGNLNGIDFVDLNCGCPIDIVFQTGAGAALLDTPSKLGKIVLGMNRALGDIPLTIKVRMGVKDGKNTAHKLVPRLRSWGVGGMTIHGRTRQQRYTKLADWDYIKPVSMSFATKLRTTTPPQFRYLVGEMCILPRLTGIAWENMVWHGIMIGRGALIKPWIFTEIKERREWDISSRERLELIRKYAEFGLNHWGSDSMGVNTTRRYLCEALSFQYRYVPIGLLEVMPGRINDRPPAFRGRDELETLLASPRSTDWVKISEMFLGPTPEDWNFIPKHKSNAVEGQG